MAQIKFGSQNLVDVYCSGNRALKAYALYRMQPKNFDPETSKNLLSLDEQAEKAHDQLGWHVARTLRQIFSSPFNIAIKNNYLDAVEFLNGMGEKVTTHDLIFAIQNNKAQMAELLITFGAPVENPNENLADQPLFYATATTDETIIDHLIKAGASFSKKYLASMDFPQLGTKTIAENYREKINKYFASSEEQRALRAGQNRIEFENTYKKILEMLNKYEKLGQQKSKRTP